MKTRNDLEHVNRGPWKKKNFARNECNKKCRMANAWLRYDVLGEVGCGFTAIHENN